MSPTPCWVWPGTLRKQDSRPVTRNSVYVYRALYELLHGPIPEGLVIDHLCGNKPCVNPEHLQAITQSDHVKVEIERGKMRRGDLNVGQAAKTHCPQGHPYGGANLYIAPNGDRMCRECRREAKRRYRAKRF